MDIDQIFITEKDYLRISNLLTLGNQFEDLEIELDRATLISDTEVPPNLVTMNSKIKYLDHDTNRESIITIVYPKDSNSTQDKVSIFAPIGSALIGLKMNQSINWMFPNGKTKKLTVLDILYQPEAAKDWHL